MENPDLEVALARIANLNPLQRRVAVQFFEKPPGTILVGKAKLQAPFSEHQFLLRSGFYQRMTEDHQEPVKHILDQFEVASLHDPTFLRGWLIANGVMELPTGDAFFENIYCEYLLIEGYVPPPTSLFSSVAQKTATLQRTIQEFETERKILETFAEEKAEEEVAKWIAAMNFKLQEHMAKCRAEGRPMKKDVTFSGVKNKTVISDQLATKLRQNGFKVKSADRPFSNHYVITYEPFPFPSRCMIM